MMSIVALVILAFSLLTPTVARGEGIARVARDAAIRSCTAAGRAFPLRFMQATLAHRGAAVNLTRFQQRDML
jgi:hypothetical protein